MSAHMLRRKRGTRPVRKSHWIRDARAWGVLLHNIFQTQCLRPAAELGRAPPEEETAFQAPIEPDHAKLREEAIRTERERLAPERVREISIAYERQAARHAWPQLPGDGLPHELKPRVTWLFLATGAFLTGAFFTTRFGATFLTTFFATFFTGFFTAFFGAAPGRPPKAETEHANAMSSSARKFMTCATFRSARGES